MIDLEKSVVHQHENAVENAVDGLIKEEVSKTSSVKNALDLMFTHDALKDKETFDNALQEKKQELKNNAEAKRIQAETEKIEKEVEKIKQEKEKELAELDKVISAKKKEVEKLKAESDKALEFFESNEDILSCIGIGTKKSLRVMYTLMIPATIIFVLIRFIALPLTIGGKLVEIIIDIISGICKSIANSALKIIISILVVALLLSGVFCAYYFGSKIIL